jgi:hypothetical protein
MDKFKASYVIHFHMLEYSNVGVRNWTSVSNVMHLRLATFNADFLQTFNKATAL